MSQDQADEAPPEGQLCDRLRNYATHESYSATRGPRGAKCPRPAKARDRNGEWACGVHLGADKRGDQNRIRSQIRWGTYVSPERLERERREAEGQGTD